MVNVVWVLIFGVALLRQAQSTAGKMENQQAESAGVRKGAADSFTGTVWVKTLVPANDQTDCIVSDVTFEPKARTFWHTHPNGQILVVTQGVGYYQERGKPIQTIRAGEAVNIAPNVEHWHGAASNSVFTHTAINPNVSKGGAVTWLQAVTDEEYNAGA